MAKVIRHLRQEQKEFQKVFSSLCDRRSSWQAWADFVECAAIEISNAVDRTGTVREEREARYVRIMKTYTTAERDAFCSLFALMVEALEVNPDQDFLGEMFMALELGNHWKGQFFTPYDVCRMMVQISTQDIEAHIERRGWVGVMDPACGAGALLIASRNEFAARGIGYRQALYVCQDVDPVAGLMCYIQLSLLGCAGYIVIANSLTNPISGPSALLPIIKPNQDFWFTPALYDEVWQARMRFEYAIRAVEVLEKQFAEAVATLAVDEERGAQGVDMTPEERPAEAWEEAAALIESETGQLSFF